MAFSPDGHRIVTGSADSTVRVWDADTGQPVGEPLTGHTGAVVGVAFSPDGRRVGHRRSTTRRCGCGTPTPATRRRAADRPHRTGARCGVQSRRRTRIVTGGDDKTVRVWDADTGQPIGEPLTGHTDAVCSVAFSPDGRRIVTGSGDETVRVWDADTGHPVGEPLTGHTGHGGRCGVQPRRPPHRLRQRRRDGAGVGRGHRQPVGEPLTGHTGSV